MFTKNYCESEDSYQRLDVERTKHTSLSLSGKSLLRLHFTGAESHFYKTPT